MGKGYFFTLDAFVAMGVIVVGLIMVLSSYSYRPLTVQGTVLSSDILLSLSSTKVTDVNNDYVRVLLQNNSISNRENTLLQQAGEFYINNQNGMGFQLVAATTDSLVPLQYFINVSINGSTIYNRGSLAKSSRLVVASRSIVFGVYNDTMWGPLPVEVKVWE